ncbi:DUF2474 domain-containing protein [Pseudaminobacter soli (ex Li et al. 2025)]|uniref:DUF2474 domain-containing protein n=1 Tax=Pseudaminobacter soli (ex Li et al. 2025) TaxID=1295366 RepID=A0A2P7SNA5_9HYPH|nr:DUF2474 domain-containing protein [Mesorhizobium soli]PSJ63974.1 DUF2474 domain-containing protein [Mesorhizobium soli]
MAAPSSLPSWPKRIGWLILIWAASVLSLGLVALAFRFVMNLAGLTV